MDLQNAIDSHISNNVIEVIRNMISSGISPNIIRIKGENEEEWNDVLKSMSLIYSGKDVDHDSIIKEHSNIIQSSLKIMQAANCLWSLPFLCKVCDDMWNFVKWTKNEKYQEEAARVINKVFTACINDRGTNDGQSRKWGTYRIAGILFRIYFHLKQLNLCTNMLRTINAAELPPIDAFPKSHICTYKFYSGRFHFLNEKFDLAEADLSFALQLCPPNSHKNKRSILIFLIPTRLIMNISRPSKALLGKYGLPPFYNSALDAMKEGNDVKYMQLLQDNMQMLVLHGTYQIFERIHIVCYRNIIRKMYLALQNTKIHIYSIHKLLTSLGMVIDEDETEAIIVHLISSGFIRAYISKEHGIIVLSAKDPFPRMLNLLQLV